VLSLGAIGFGVFVVAVNWHDYSETLDPRHKADITGGSLRRE
jgi:hypothetical protein